MSLITPADPTIRTKAEIAVDADLTAPAESWTWTELGDYTDAGRIRPRLLDQTIRIASGTTGDVDTSLIGDPTDVELLLGNGDGELTPLNPTSSIYPGLKKGTPLRLSMQAGLPHLVTRGVAGSRARTPDVGALDITTDLSGVVELLSPVQHPPFASSYDLVGKSTTGNISWLTYIFAGDVRFRWSVDGTTTTTKAPTLALPTPEAGPLSIGWWFDVDNGASGNTLWWYVWRGGVDDLLDNLDSAIHGDPVVHSGATSIFSGSAPLDLGDISLGFTPYPGRWRRFQLRAGDLSTGTVVADLDATSLTTDATGTTDSAGRVWSFTDARIDDWRPRACVRVVRSEASWGAVDPALPTEAYVNVRSEGILERLADRASPVRSTLMRAITSPANADLVVAAWPHEDNRQATRLAQVIAGAAPMSIRGDFTPGGDTDYPATLQQLTIASGDTAYRSAPIPQIPQVVGVQWEVTQFLRITDPATDPLGTQIMAVDTNGRVATWRVNINDTQATITGIDIDGGGVVLDTVTSDPTWFDGGEVTVVLEVADDGANVDWLLRVLPPATGLGYVVSGTFTGDTGVPSMFRNNCVAPPGGISLGPLIVTSGAGSGWLAPADSAFVGEPASQRVFRLCQENGIPIAVHGPYGYDWDAAVAVRATPLGPQRPRTVLELLVECAEADHAIITEQRGALGLVYRAGASLMNQPVRLSLSRAARLVDQPFRPVDDDVRLVNDVTVSRTDGSSAHVEDPRIGTGAVERYDRDYEVNVETDLQLPAAAGWRYHLGTWTELRYPEIRAAPHRQASIVEDMLGFAVGDRFQVTDPPPGHPPDPVDQLAYGIAEDLERFGWRASLNGRPARPWDTAVVDDGDFGRVDTAGSEITAPFTSGTDTSMSVATTSGTVWVTDASEFPFDIEAAGARLRVTAISGATSPQTFTISATPVNGVAKTIPTGTPIRLWQGAVIAP